MARRSTSSGKGAASPWPSNKGAFAISTQKLLDYAFRSVHVTAETAKRVAETYFGMRRKRAYFLGCSNGGRQGLIAAQRFPDDFDEISAGAPVLDFVSTHVNYVSIMRSMAKAPVSEDKLKIAGKIIYALCDEKDGVKDSLIEDPRRCDTHRHKLPGDRKLFWEEVARNRELIRAASGIAPEHFANYALEKA